MADQPKIPTGISCYLHPKGGRASEAAEFYKKAFGAAEVMRNTADDGKRLMHGAHAAGEPVLGRSLRLRPRSVRRGLVDRRTGQGLTPRAVPVDRATQSRTIGP